MARSDRLNRKRLSRISDRSFQEPTGNDPKPAGFKISTPAPHRQLSLLALTIILNTLLWSSIVCIVIAFFQLGTDSDDHTNVLPGVLTLVSAIVTVAYTAVHTTYSVNQRALTYQQLDAATIRKTTYIANRLVISLCVLWLLTAGWNMILVARRPSCLPNKSDGQSWEAGVTCLVSRVGMALAMIALVASLALFGMMAAIRRPFEAHLFAYGQRLPNDDEPSPPGTRRTSEDHTATEKLVARSSISIYAHTRSMSRLSNFTNADVETLDLNASRPASIAQPPSPSGDRIEIFTSPFAPPPLPPGFIPSRASSPTGRSPKTLPGPFAHQRRISLTPRTDALLAPAAYVPNSIPIEFSASAQRAVYPDAATPYRSINTCRSQPHLRSMSSFSNRHRYSRSSVSLSRPHRLSTVTPVPYLESSSRTNTLTSATCVSDKSESVDSKSVVSSTVVSSTDKRASAAEIVSAIANNAPIPGTEKSSPRKHWRTVSTPIVLAGAQQSPHSGQRMAMGWKPVLSKSSTMLRKQRPISFDKLVRSASADLLGRFGPLANADTQDKEMAWKKDFEREIEDRLNDLHTLPFPEDRKSVSTDGETLRESFDTKSLEDDTRFEDAKEVLRPVSREVAPVRSGA